MICGQIFERGPGLNEAGEVVLETRANSQYDACRACSQKRLVLGIWMYHKSLQRPVPRNVPEEWIREEDDISPFNGIMNKFDEFSKLHNGLPLITASGLKSKQAAGIVLINGSCQLFNDSWDKLEGRAEEPAQDTFHNLLPLHLPQRQCIPLSDLAFQLRLAVFRLLDTLVVSRKISCPQRIPHSQLPRFHCGILGPQLQRHQNLTRFDIVPMIGYRDLTRPAIEKSQVIQQFSILGIDLT